MICQGCPRADNIYDRCYCDEEETCNGICLTASDIGLPEYGGVVAYAHPDCPEHGCPVEEFEAEEEICGGGDESLRYVREEDMDFEGENA